MWHVKIFVVSGFVRCLGSSLTYLGSKRNFRGDEKGLHEAEIWIYAPWWELSSWGRINVLFSRWQRKLRGVLSPPMIGRHNGKVFGHFPVHRGESKILYLSSAGATIPDRFACANTLNTLPECENSLRLNDNNDTLATFGEIIKLIPTQDRRTCRNTLRNILQRTKKPSRIAI